MKNTNKDIESVKYLIDYMLKNRIEIYSSKPFNKYSRAYFCTNENIKRYLNIAKLDLSDNALCVLASGDHPFNLITLGIMNIDTFDINRIAPYIALGLKRALILKYSYQEYLNICEKLCNKLTPLTELTDILNDLLPFMDKNYRYFWQSIINYNYQKQKNLTNVTNLFYLITQNAYGFKRSTRGNNFLESIDEYNKLKDRILNANINFQNNDLLNITKNNKYNLILLSNILTYYEKQYKKAFKNEEKEYILNLGKYNSIIYLNYLFENELYFAKNNWEYLKEEGYNFLSVPPLSYLYDEDIVIYKRIK